MFSTLQYTFILKIYHLDPVYSNICTCKHYCLNIKQPGQIFQVFSFIGRPALLWLKCQLVQYYSLFILFILFMVWMCVWVLFYVFQEGVSVQYWFVLLKSVNMGINIEQYRAAIGMFNCTRMKLVIINFHIMFVCHVLLNLLICTYFILKLLCFGDIELR